MRSSLVLLLAAGACLSAQVRFSPSDISVNIDGKPFTTFHYGADANKPYLAPLRSASGKIVTRRFPMKDVPGESRDHLHHRGLWFSYDDVNGVKFWENDPSYRHPNMGRIVVRDAQWKNGEHSGALTATMDWRDMNDKVLLVENRTMVFYSDPVLRTIDFHITLTAAEDVTFGDTKEGAFAIRLADNFTARKGLTMVDADGRSGMKAIWGQRSNWVDYSADVDGEKLGVAIFDNPENPRHPTYWHARDYGLFALNPFGQHAFNPKLDESHWKLPAGHKLTFQWRVVIHPGDAQSANIADLYKQYAH
ncbi:MAG: PmoA family protein [Bryobacteraceae bacterium]